MANRAKVQASIERRRRANSRPHTNMLIMALFLTMIFVISLSKVLPGEGLDTSQYAALIGIVIFIAAAFLLPNLTPAMQRDRNARRGIIMCPNRKYIASDGSHHMSPTGREIDCCCGGLHESHESNV